MHLLPRSKKVDWVLWTSCLKDSIEAFLVLKAILHLSSPGDKCLKRLKCIIIRLDCEFWNHQFCSRMPSGPQKFLWRGWLRRFFFPYSQIHFY
mmetsp:Transcript_28378/g.82189  ORF Transcript_28378/g.82189 Transcript_28378/m.82189 type:complete len:93 (+) Transcript_28378:228-506(+)